MRSPHQQKGSVPPPCALAVIAAAVLALGACGPAGTPVTDPSPPGGQPGPPTTAVSGLVTIGGGRRLYLSCTGSGGPTVVLETGYGDSGAVWNYDPAPAAGRTMVQAGVAQHTRVCVYNRPGTKTPGAGEDPATRSDPIAMPRTAADLVTDLHLLLRAAAVPAPYVLVGHSLGGILVRLYASTYPDDVAGMVLVDSSHEDQIRRWQAALTAEQWAMFTTQTQGTAPDFDERIDLDVSCRQLGEAAAVAPLRQMPLAVLSAAPPSHDTPPGLLPADMLAKFDAIHIDLQHQLATLVAGARHITTTSGHNLQLDRPDLVLTAINDVVDAVRNGASTL